MANEEKSLTKSKKIGKLSKKESEIRKRSLNGKIILVLNVYKGGVTDIQEYSKIETFSE